MTFDEVARFKRHFFGDRPYIDRLSLAFVSRLLTDERARNEHLEIFHEIECLEDFGSASGTKDASPFGHPPLNRFWHKHFSSTRHLLRNVGEEWGLPRAGNRKLTAAINEVARSHGEKPDEWPGVLVHKIWLEGYQIRSRERRRTGD